MKDITWRPPWASQRIILTKVNFCDPPAIDASAHPFDEVKRRMEATL